MRAIRGLMLGALLGGAVAHAASGCSPFDADDPTPSPVPDAPPEAGATDADGQAPPLDVDATDDGARCTTKELDVEAVADTNFSDQCNGTITYGSDDFLHIGHQSGLGVGLLRFELDDAQRAALEGKVVAGGALVLTANPTCSACGGGIRTEHGTMEVHALRSDWDEGTSGGSGDGADRCRRKSGKGWGSSRPAGGGTALVSGVDYDTEADSVAVNDDQLAVTVPLSARALGSRNASIDGTFSFLLRMVGGRIIVATKESTFGGAHLKVQYCE